MRKFLLGLILLCLTGCQPLAARPTSTPQIIQVVMTAGTRPWTDRLNQCANQTPGSALIVHEVPASALDLSRAELGLRFGAPGQPAPFSAEIGQDGFAIIANPGTVNLDRPLAQLRELFLGDDHPWEMEPTGEPTGTPQPAPDVQVWSYPAGDDIRLAFENSFLEGNSISTGVNLAPDPQAMLEAVSKNAGAIGYLPKSMVTDSVSVLNIPDSDQPILAIAKSEPQGLARQILVCLQKSN